MIMKKEALKIDVHHHFIPDVYRKALEAKGTVKSGGMTIKEWNPEQNIELMDRLEIQVAIGSISEPGLNPFTDKKEARKLARATNEYFAKMITDYPERYGAFAILPLPDIDAALEEISYALDVLKLDGVNMLSNYQDQFLGNTLFNPVFEELNRRNAVIHIHPSAPASSFKRPEFAAVDFMEEFTFNTTRAATNLILGGTMERCRDLRIILSHGGGTLPYLQNRINDSQNILENLKAPVPYLEIDARDYMANFYYDTALATGEISLHGVRGITSAAHILFGSDANFAPEDTSRDMISQLIAYEGFDNSMFQDIIQRNALNLFPRLKTSIRSGELLIN
jgi:predicted TIM-barrel fold metal-dependent hydrolase